MTSHDVPGTCPSAEVLGSFVEGRLAAGARQSVLTHVTSCEACLFVIGETAVFRRDEAAALPVEEDSDVRPPRGGRRWVAVAAAVALGLVALTSWRLLLPRDPIHPLVSVARHAPFRPLEARLADFDHAPFSPLRAGPLRLPEVRAAATVTIEHVRGRTSPAAVHARGIAYLLLGHVDAAVTYLAGAAAAAPGDPAMWSDLAAARYTLGTQRNDRAELHRARSAADAALRLQPDFAAALFNRALIDERLGDVAAAVAGHAACQRVDASSPWAAESRARIRILTTH